MDDKEKEPDCPFIGYECPYKTNLEQTICTAKAGQSCLCPWIDEDFID